MGTFSVVDDFIIFCLHRNEIWREEILISFTANSTSFFGGGVYFFFLLLSTNLVHVVICRWRKIDYWIIFFMNNSEQNYAISDFDPDMFYQAVEET